MLNKKITESIASNDINLTFIPTSKAELLNEIENIVKKYFQANTHQIRNESQSDIIFLNECSKLTNLSKATIYTLVNQRKIPFIKPAGVKKLMFSKVAIMDFLLQGRHTISEKKANVKINNRKS